MEFDEIRRIERDGETWYVASDVCKAIGLGTTARALGRIDPRSVDKAAIRTAGGEQAVSIISESGLIALVTGSRKPKARALAGRMGWTAPGAEQTVNDIGALSLYQDPQFGNVRAKMLDGEPWFNAGDVCNLLDIQNTSQAMERLDEDEKRLFPTYTGSNTLSWYVNEPGLYTLIFHSNKPEAEAFKDWVCEDVLPSIRKHGMYATPMTIEKMLDDPDAAIQAWTALAAHLARPART